MLVFTQDELDRLNVCFHNLDRRIILSSVELKKLLNQSASDPHLLCGDILCNVVIRRLEEEVIDTTNGIKH